LKIINTAVMKKTGFISTAIILLILVVPVQRVKAQDDKSKEEKEHQMQELIDAQKRQMAEQKKAQEEMMKALQERQEDLNRVREDFRIRIDTNDFGRIMRVYGDGGRNWYNYSADRPDRILITPDINTWVPYLSGDSERTSWDFSKSIKEKSFSQNYIFNVDPTAETVVMLVNGDCRAGDIKIKIIMPNGKTYSDIVIDEFGNLNWRKSFKISDEENQDKAGAWKFDIKANNATGYFRISIQTY
jgi:hypothetical protein